MKLDEAWLDSIATRRDDDPFRPTGREVKLDRGTFDVMFGGMGGEKVFEMRGGEL